MILPFWLFFSFLYSCLRAFKTFVEIDDMFNDPDENKILSKRLYSRILLIFVFPIAPFIFVFDFIVFMKKLRNGSE